MGYRLHKKFDVKPKLTLEYIFGTNPNKLMLNFNSELDERKGWLKNNNEIFWPDYKSGVKWIDKILKVNK